MINLQDTVITELTKYYETFDKDSAEYIRQYFVIDSIELKDYLIRTCKETHPKKFGFPDISVLCKIYKNAPVPSSSNTFSACECKECKTLYAIDMMYCPVCWTNGKKVTEHFVRMSDVSLRIINYNKKCANRKIEEQYAKDYNKPVETLCYDCDERENSFCSHFGETKYNCANKDECTCYRCCAIARRWQESENNKREQRGKK